MSRCVRAGWVPLVGLVFGLAAGCGTTASPAADKELFYQGSLGEVGGIYESYIADAKKPPTKLADLTKYELGMPTGYKELKEGNVVVLWGAPISDGDADKVFAYEKSVPESGGHVLMADGKTIKTLTAEQFKSVPKAAGKAASK